MAPGSWKTYFWDCKSTREMLKPIFGNRKNFERFIFERDEIIRKRWLLKMGANP